MAIPQIKDLRSMVTLLKNNETADATDVETTKSYTTIATVRAQILLFNPMMFIGNIQLSYKLDPTHSIVIRTISNTDIFDTITCERYMPDRTKRRETYRVLGLMDLDNQRRFTRIDAKLETYESVD